MRIDYENGYLYVDCIENISELKQAGFDFEDFRSDIMDECLKRGYISSEVNHILDIIRIRFNMLSI